MTGAAQTFPPLFQMLIPWWRRAPRRPIVSVRATPTRLSLRPTPGRPFVSVCCTRTETEASPIASGPSTATLGKNCLSLTAASIRRSLVPTLNSRPARASVTTLIRSRWVRATVLGGETTSTSSPPAQAGASNLRATICIELTRLATSSMGTGESLEFYPQAAHSYARTFRRSARGDHESRREPPGLCLHRELPPPL